MWKDNCNAKNKGFRLRCANSMMSNDHRNFVLSVSTMKSRVISGTNLEKFRFNLQVSTDCLTLHKLKPH